MAPVAVALLTLGFALAQAPRPASALTGGQRITIPFPRLGMFWPDSSAQSAAERARYDWIVLGANDADRIAELRALNPDIIVLGSTNARALSYDKYNYNSSTNADIRKASNRWILTQAGSTLTANVDAAQTYLPVADTSRFRAGEALVIGEELAVITSVGSSNLYVQRGVAKPAASHTAGTRVASAVSGWRNAVMMDVTTNCPLVNVGNGVAENWNSFNARRGHAVIHTGDWDGVMMDSATPSPSWMIEKGMLRSIDQPRTNVAPTDYSAFDDAWNEGMVAYGNTLRNLAGPDEILLPNYGVKNYNLNGNNFEEFPENRTSQYLWYKTTIGPASAPNASYLDWAANAAQPNLTTIETYQFDDDLPSNWQSYSLDYQKMRFGLCTALLGDGFYSFEICTDGHGALGLYWFDEYDNAGAGRGYLGQPLGAAYHVGSNVWRRDYQNGIALVNPDGVAHTVDLGDSFRKIRGRQVLSVNDGSLVSGVTLQSHDGIVLLRPGAAGVPSGEPVFRFYKPGSGTHFYTASVAEKNSVIGSLGGTYSFEGVSFYVSQDPSGKVPVYRFYKPGTGTHFYTASEAEKNSVIGNLGGTYSFEGVSFYVSP